MEAVEKLKANGDAALQRAEVESAVQSYTLAIDKTRALLQNIQRRKEEETASPPARRNESTLSGARRYRAKGSLLAARQLACGARVQGKQREETKNIALA